GAARPQLGGEPGGRCRGRGRRHWGGSLPDRPAGRGMTGPLLLHATAVAIDGCAVLLRGVSGSGKSDLALRLIDAGARLVADDQSELHRQGETIVVRSPPAIAGLIEVRGVGLVRVDPWAEAPVGLIDDLMSPEACL